MPVVPGGGFFNGAPLGLLSECAVTGHGRRAAHASSFVRCDDDPRPRTVTVAAPACIESGENCSSEQDLAKLQKFAAAIDDSMQDELAAMKKARERFLRRSCDYQYAEHEDKAELLANTYGPKGPLLPGGSYLFELRRWADAAYMLHRQCGRGMGGCQSLIAYLKDHPEDDLAPGNMHGKAGSKVYTELRKACDIGKTRSPVPNDGPVWCDPETGLCEQKSCRKWWRKIHLGAKEPWIDDRLEYNDLKEACSWIENHTPTSRELNKYQGGVQTASLEQKINFCRPRWVEGYCESTKDSKHRSGQCTLKDGKWCKNGQIFPDSENDDTSGWAEPFKEKPVTAEPSRSLAPSPLLAALLPSPPALTVSSPEGQLSGSGRPCASRYREFL